MASLELAFEPKPLSVSVQKVPSWHGLDAGEALDRLAVEGKLQVGDAGAVLAGNGAERFSALAVRRRELAGMLQKFRRIGGRRDVIVLAGRIAWAASFAGNACSSATAELRSKTKSAVKQEEPFHE